MTALPPHRRRSAAVALVAVLVACAAVALTQSPEKSRQHPAPPPAAAPEPAPPATTPPRPRRRRQATKTPARERPALRPRGSDAPSRIAPAQRRRARAARRIAAAFARAWTRYTAEPSDRRAAQAVKATSTASLWRQLRQVRSTAGRYQPADRYHAIAGVSVPLSGQRLEVTIELRDRGGRRQYLTVLAEPTEAGWKIAEIVL